MRIEDDGQLQQLASLLHASSERLDLLLKFASFGEDLSRVALARLRQLFSCGQQLFSIRIRVLQVE